MNHQRMTRTHSASRIPHLTSRLLLATFLLLSGCASVPGGSESPPSPTPVEAIPTAETAGAPTEVPGETPPEATVATATPAPVEPALAATPPPVTEAPRPASRAEIGGRLLYARKGNLFRWTNGASTQLTSSGDLAWPRWSPDGQHIAAVRRGDSFSDLYILDAQGQGDTQMTRYKSKAPLGSKEYVLASVWAVTPTWVPDGTRLLYAADVTADNMALWQVDVKGGPPRPLAATADLGANIESPTYSPDGKSLAFCLARDTPTQLWMLNLDTGGRAQLTDGKQTTYDPAWSPDGSLLAVAIQEGTSSSIVLLTPDGKQRTPLITRPAARAPAWSPDGRQLAFIGEEDGRFNVFVVELTSDGAGGFTASEPRRLTNDGDIDAPSGLSWTK